MSETDTGTQADQTALSADQNAQDTAPEQTVATETDAQTNPPDEAAAKAAEKGEADKQLARAAFEVREARREAKAAKAELDAIKAAHPPAPNSPEARAAEIKSEAAEMVKAQAFNAKCDDIFAAGVKEFPDFRDAIGQFSTIGGLPNALIEAADEAGEPHKILRYLGQHPDEAEALIALSPSRMGAAVAKLVAKATAAPTPPPVSKAPPPPTTVSGQNRAEIDPYKMSMDDYMKWEREHRGKRSG